MFFLAFVFVNTQGKLFSFDNIYRFGQFIVAVLMMAMIGMIVVNVIRLLFSVRKRWRSFKKKYIYIYIEFY